jgi:undecaprenyl diphosphate synthase
LHVAIIMDGNGRWATRRGLPRTAGHREGAKALQRVLEAAPELDIRVLTVFALSSDNWQRPRTEVHTLLRLLKRRLRAEMQALRENGIRLTVIGRRDRLPGDVLRAIEEAEALTATCGEWHLRIALDYSSRDAILSAARRCNAAPDFTPGEFARLLAGSGCESVPEVDLLIRTGGEQRLSDFLLWECAYAELYFSPILWPDFDGQALASAVADFHRRDRRFGKIASGGGASQSPVVAVTA